MRIMRADHIVDIGNCSSHAYMTNRLKCFFFRFKTFRAACYRFAIDNTKLPIPPEIVFRMYDEAHVQEPMKLIDPT